MEAVVFDMDGTLVDSERAHYEAERIVLAKRGVGLSFQQYLEYFVGRTDHEALAGFLESRHGVREMAREKNELFISLIPRLVKPFKQTVGVARSLGKSGARLGLATSAVEAEAKALLEHLGLKKFFKIVVTGNNVRRGKPAPDIYLLAAKKLGARPRACTVVEDSVTGIAAAKSAGMRVVAVTHTYEKKFLAKADAIVNDLAPGGSKKLLKAITEQ